MKNPFLYEVLSDPLQRCVRANHKHKLQGVLTRIHPRVAALEAWAVLSIGLLLWFPASAQNYSVNWFKVAGGGGTSTNGQFSISGTIGQADAGQPMTGGNFTLTGGFWSLFAVNTPGSPLLKIFLTFTNTAVVQWPSPSTGFVLQQSTDLAAPSWVPPLETVNDNGTVKFIIVNPPAGKRFYRLKL